MAAPDYTNLVPESVVGEIVQALQEESAAIRLGNVIPIPTGVASVPVLSVAPQAAFVTPRYGGRKPATTIDWTAERLVAEEIACVLPIPDQFIDDSSYPVWDSVRPALASALAFTLDQAVFFGVDAPASYPTGGVAAPAQPPVGTASDTAGSLDAAMAVVEESGLEPDGIASSALIKQALRAEARNQMISVQEQIAYSFYGVPTVVVTPWDSSKGDAIVGAFGTCLLIGLRQDVTFQLSSDGVLLDDTGAIIVSGFQDDQTLMRVHMRVGVAIGTPTGPDGTATTPFKAAKWTSGTTARSKSS
jgi:hypothetical protein